MSILSGYKREERPTVEGVRRCKIVEVKEAISQAGNHMLVISVRPSGVWQTVRAYIVFNNYFNQHVTEVFDAFPSLGGTTELDKWKGAIGAAEFSTDDKGYIHVDEWIRAEFTTHLPPYIESEVVM